MAQSHMLIGAPTRLDHLAIRRIGTTDLIDAL
jgi:hypothetical protein